MKYSISSRMRDITSLGPCSSDLQETRMTAVDLLELLESNFTRTVGVTSRTPSHESDSIMITGGLSRRWARAAAAPRRSWHWPPRQAAIPMIIRVRVRV